MAALRGHIEDSRPVPAPTAALPGQPTVNLPPLAAAKLALYAAMLRAGLDGVTLAERIGLKPSKVRQLLDLDYPSSVDQVGTALAKLGKELELRVVDAA